MIGDRGDVAGQRLDARLGILLQIVLRVEKQHDAAQAQQAVACLGGKIAVAANASQHVLEAAALLHVAPLAARPQARGVGLLGKDIA